MGHGVPPTAYTMLPTEHYQLNPKTYEWSARLFNSVRKALRVNIKMHYDQDQVNRGDIFLFNHFARFETFIPQYLIYRESGAFCRSVAASQFFKANETFAAYLTNLGAVPNDLPDLLSFLAAEVLRGRKVVVFPEGGMVKDRRVIDSRGVYGIYSRRAKQRRKHHSGAAVLATGLEAFKHALRRSQARHGNRMIEHWAERLGLADPETLLSALARPTTIIPANITFYPLRVDENLLSRSIGRFNRDLSARATEELLVEGNILLKDTDMDIRLGAPLSPADHWNWWEKLVVRELGRQLTDFDAYFSHDSHAGGLLERIYRLGRRRSVGLLRDDYMRLMYASVTVNLSHLASTIIDRLAGQKRSEIPIAEFHTALYLSIKLLQREKKVHLHRSLKNPEAYANVMDGHCHGVQQFIQSMVSLELVETRGESLAISSKLRQEHEFDQIRLENPIAVYANETAPLLGVRRSVEEALSGSTRINMRDLAKLRFDDERIAYEWDHAYFRKSRFEQINAQETATESGEPFLFTPTAARALGVVLVHGFLASPAETRGFGEQLAELGYPSIGIRLKGHGTSPWDLRERTWFDWLESVRRGFAILSPFVEHICVIGFSTGAALSLMLASEQPPMLAGIGAISTPMRFMNRNMLFVPLVHGANRLVQRVTPAEGLMPFRLNETQHPHINYRHMPIRALYELKRLVDTLQQSIANVQCPVIVMQATEDTVVDPRSAGLLYEALSNSDKSLVMVPSVRHRRLRERSVRGLPGGLHLPEARAHRDRGCRWGVGPRLHWVDPDLHGPGIEPGPRELHHGRDRGHGHRRCRDHSRPSTLHRGD